MRRALLLCLVTGSLLPLSGCGRGAYNQNAKFYEELIASADALSVAFEAVKDPESAKVALPGIHAALDRFETLPPKAAAIPKKMTISENQSLREKYIGDWNVATVRLAGAARLAQLSSKHDPAIKAAAERLQDAATALKKGLAVGI